MRSSYSYTMRRPNFLNCGPFPEILQRPNVLTATRRNAAVSITVKKIVAFWVRRDGLGKGCSITGVRSRDDSRGIEQRCAFCFFRMRRAQLGQALNAPDRPNLHSFTSE